MKLNKIDKFDPQDLIKSMKEAEAHASGKITLKTHELKLPPPVESISSAEIRAIREKLKVSQSVFARILNIPIGTETAWESGARHPSGAALRLLEIVRNKPEVIFDSAEVKSAQNRSTSGRGITRRHNLSKEPKAA